MSDLLITGLLTKLGANILANTAKKTVEAIRDLVSEDEAKAIIIRAFIEFKENVIINNSMKDEKVLLEVFEEFFSDDRTIEEFQLIFETQCEKVDFDLLEEIFVGICIDKNLDIPAFDFRRAISYVIKEIEQLAQKQDKFKKLFQTTNLERIYKSLQTRGKEPNLSFARFKYLSQLQRHHNQLFFSGIPDLKEKKEIQLSSIFVMPRARESVDLADYHLFTQKKQGDEDFTGEEIKLQQMLVKKETEKAPLKFDKIFNESMDRCLVVLGKPGSGKSTLLKFLVLEAARLLRENHRTNNLLFPILVEIRKFENALSKTNRTDYNILDFLYDSMRTFYNLDLPDGFFEYYLDSGRALLLFDGLDEVAAENRRAEIQQMIASFVSSYSVSNRVIVTSRIAGYSRAQFSTMDYRHFTLEDFGDEEIGAFIKNWYRSRLTNEKEAEIKANDLKDALKKKPRIKELARNPLLLTIIGIIHRYEAQLPEDRLLLYDKATETLLYTWDNVKAIIDQKFKPDAKRQFLEKVAFHLQSMEKGDEAGTMLDRSEVYEILFPDFCRIFGCDNRQAKGHVDEFLDNIRTRAGLLVEQAPDRYGFVHKTFQEYFAARWIANEALLNFDLQIMLDYADKYIDNALWHETLLLALRALPNRQVQKVLDHILTQSDPKGLEPYFYHHHYFVMKFIAEQGSWLNNKEFVENQIDDFFRFSWNKGEDRSYFKNYPWKRFTEWISSVSDSLAFSILSVKFLILEEKKEIRFLYYKSDAIAIDYLGLKDLEVLFHLAADKKQDLSFRFDCLNTLIKSKAIDKSMVERLLHFAEDNGQDNFLRRACADALGKAVLNDKDIVERLLFLSEDVKQDNFLRYDCIRAIGNFGLKEKAIIQRLMCLIEDETQENSIRRDCVYALSNTGLNEKVFVEQLLFLAEDEKNNDYLRRDCVEAVGKLGLKEKLIVQRLINLAEDEKQARFFRCSCVEAIGKIGLKKKDIIKRLFHLAENKKHEGSFRRICAEALSKLEEKEGAVDILADLYLAEKNKYSLDARIIYDSLWELTAEERIEEKRKKCTGQVEFKRKYLFPYLNF